jgi:hypothetical protein
MVQAAWESDIKIVWEVWGIPALKQYHVRLFISELRRQLLLNSIVTLPVYFFEKEASTDNCDHAYSDNALAQLPISSLCPIETRHYSYTVNPRFLGRYPPTWML